ncbi:MAG: hypothetical protein ABIE84_06180, partial [bacterium]
MAKKTLDTIKAIEEKAAEIIRQAKQQAAALLAETANKNKTDKEAQVAKLKETALGIIKKAETEAQAETGKIEKNSQKEISELIAKTKPK